MCCLMLLSNAVSGQRPQAPYDPHAEANTFYYNVESTGALPPEDIVTSSVNVLTTKLQELRYHLQDML